MRLTRLYTRAGDAGTTRLADGTEVPKDGERVSAYGSVDELNSALGVALADSGISERLTDPLRRIQNELFDLGGDLATPRDSRLEVPRVVAASIERLEGLIDELNEDTGPLENFVLPGGTAAAAALHLARTVCRRAERDVVRLARVADIGAVAVPYLNRLSDLLFAMARWDNAAAGRAEPIWEPQDGAAE